jgi:cyclohexadienyl dehydratase
MKKIIATVLLISYFLGIAFAGNAFNEIKKSDILRVGTTGDFAPMTYWNPKTKKYIGFDIDMAKSLGKHLGLKVEFVKTTWQTLTHDLLNNKFDIAMGGITATKERAESFLFSTPVMNTGKVPLILKKNKERFTTMKDIDKAGIIIVANNGGTNMQFALSNIKNAVIYIVPENKMNFEYILNGKADVFFTDNIEALHEEKSNPKFFAINPEKPLTHEYMVYLIPKNNEELKIKVNNWLNKTINNGEYDKYYKEALSIEKK